MQRWLGVLACAMAAAGCARVADLYQTSPPRIGSEIGVLVSVASNPDPYRAGQTAADLLQRQMLKPPQAVILSECFEGAARKRQALSGVRSVFGSSVIFGAATYGSFTHAGCADRDSVALLGIYGEGVSVAAALERGLGTATLNDEKDQPEIQRRLRAAGARLASKLPRDASRKLLIVLADAHSPKDGPLVEGIQDIMTKDFPITGGSANKNAGQTYVYYQGQMYQDSAVAILLSGDFYTAMVGRQAKDNDQVIATAKAAAFEAMGSIKRNVFAVIAFDCAGRKGKLKNPDDEVQALKQVVPPEVPLFGCYCAGEIGPPDVPAQQPNAPSAGVGWHVMVTTLGR